jgi:23S rRNA (adenine2030-N6)-methyltransferase
MNYRHIYHAGNFADVMKHAVLALVVEALKKKDAPFYALDTHAGIGTYDLASIEAGKTQEWREGIGRVLANASPAAELAPYLGAIGAANSFQDVMPAKAGIQEANETVDSRLRGNDSKGEGIRWYPGSARIIRTLMRRGDRLVACELHPADAQTLDEEFARDRQVKVHALDGWLALKSFLPPKERRGLVLIDPPYEEPGELARLATGLREAHARWATGIYLAWYPIKDRTEADEFLAAIVASGIRRVASCEMLLRPASDPDRLSGSGLVIINPPWGLEGALRAMVPDLARMLGGAGAWSRVESLVGE